MVRAVTTTVAPLPAKYHERDRAAAAAAAAAAANFGSDQQGEAAKAQQGVSSQPLSAVDSGNPGLL